jgi:hypothetical protein
MGFMDFFTSHQSFPGVSQTQQNALEAFLKWGKSPANWTPGSGAGMEIQDLANMFKAVQDAQATGTPFYKSLIPSAPGALSPAAAAEKAAATDALQSSLGSARVGQLGQLNREYGGRLPASMVQSGFGNLARAGAQGSTDIARQAIGENINLGEQGVQGLAGLSTLGTVPLGAVNSGIGGSMAGGFVAPPMGKEIGQTLGALAGGVAGFAGLGGGGGMPATLPNTLSPSAFNNLNLPIQNKYAPIGGLT